METLTTKPTDEMLKKEVTKPEIVDLREMKTFEMKEGLYVYYVFVITVPSLGLTLAMTIFKQTPDDVWKMAFQQTGHTDKIPALYPDDPASSGVENGKDGSDETREAMFWVAISVGEGIEGAYPDRQVLKFAKGIKSDDLDVIAKYMAMIPFASLPTGTHNAN